MNENKYDENNLLDHLEELKIVFDTLEDTNWGAKGKNGNGITYQ